MEIGKRREVITIEEKNDLTCLCHDCKHFDYDFYMDIDCKATVKDYDTVKGIGVVRCDKFKIHPMRV